MLHHQLHTAIWKEYGGEKVDFPLKLCVIILHTSTFVPCLPLQRRLSSGRCDIVLICTISISCGSSKQVEALPLYVNKYCLI